MKKNTRDKILDTAIELLWQQSYGSVSVDDICKAAKIQKGSFYHYFPSKIDVVVEAYEKLWNDSRPVLDGIFSASLSPMERLENYCNFAYEKQAAIAKQAGKVLGCPYVTCGSELSTLDERVRQKMDEMFSRFSKYLESMLRDAEAAGLASHENVAVEAQKMLSYISGVKYQAKLKNDVEIIKRDLKDGLLYYFNGLEGKESKIDRLVKSASIVKKKKIN